MADEGTGTDETTTGAAPALAAAVAASPPSAAPPGPRAGLVAGIAVGRYVVIERVGQGGLGVVYKAYDRELDRRVALKLVRARKRGSEALETARIRLLREAQALAKLDHPCVVPIYDVGTHGADVFVAMAYLEGSTLGAWLKAAPRSVAEIQRVFAAAGEGLWAAHRAGLVHRDFKPENVLVGKDGSVRVLDFGLALATGTTTSTDEGHATGVGSSEPPGATASGGAPPSSGGLGRGVGMGLGAPARLTHEGDRMGTPLYMAPEQHLGTTIDERCDQFSFALALYEAVYREHPFDAPSYEALVEAVTSGRMRPPPAGRPVPRRLRALLRRALSTSPADRYPNMAALLADLTHDPWAAPRRWGPIALGAVLLAASVLAFRRGTTATPAPCDGAAQRLNGVWDAPRRDGLSRAFAATKVPYAESSFVSVSRALDRYAERWVASRRDVCEATRVRGEAPATAMEARTLCLERRLVELRAQVDVLLEATTSTVEKSVAATAALPRLETCTDPEALSETQLPGPGEARAQIEAAGREIARARALVAAGRPRDAVALAQAAVARAKSSAYAPLEAEALLVLGSAQRDNSELEPAVTTLEQAARAGLAAGRDEIVGRAWTLLGVVTGYSLSRFDEGAGYVRNAEAIARRPHVPEELVGEVHDADAQLAFARGRFDEARAAARRAADVFERTYGPRSPQTAAALMSVASAMAMLDRLEDAEATFQEARSVLESSLGPDHPRTAAALNNLGGVAKLARRHLEAVAHHTRAYEVWSRSLGPEHMNTAAALMNRGTDYALLHRYEEARADLEHALRIYDARVGTAGRDRALAEQNLGEVLAKMGQPKAAVTHLENAMATLRDGDLANYTLAEVGLGSALVKVGDGARGLALLREAVARAPTLFGADARPTWELRMTLAEALATTGHTAEAKALAEDAHAVASRTDETSYGRAMATASLAKVLWTLPAERSRARSLAEEALGGFRAAGEEGRPDREELEAWLAHAR